MTGHDDTIEAVIEEGLVPVDGEDVTFEAPWQARAFAIAVALYDRDDGADWRTFQSRLVHHLEDVDRAAMQDDVENVYYEQWLESLEGVLVDDGVLTREEVDRRKAEFSDGERDAAEFVVGDVDH